MTDENADMMEAVLAVLFDEDEIRVGRCFGLEEIHVESIFNVVARDKLAFNLTILLKAVDMSVKSVLNQPQKHLHMIVHMLLMMHQLYRRLLVVDESTVNLMETVSNFKMFCTNRLVRLVHLLGRDELDLRELGQKEWKVFIDVLEQYTLMPKLALNALRHSAKN